MYNVTDEEMDKVRAWLINHEYTILYETENVGPDHETILRVVKDGDDFGCTVRTNTSVIPSSRPLIIRLEKMIVNWDGKYT